MFLRLPRFALARSYATIQQSPAAGGAITVDAPAGRVVKSPTAKKTVVLRDYVDYYNDNSTMLILQHNNLTQSQLIQIRSELGALQARLRILRVGLFSHAIKLTHLRSDPAWSDKDINLQSVNVAAKKKRHTTGLDVTQLLSGPICAITFPTISAVEPKTLKKVLELVDGTNNRLLLLGGKFESQVFAVDALSRVASLPGIDTLRGQLLSVLGSPALRLSQLLGSPAQALSRTVQGYEVPLKAGEEQNKAS